jgi:hypothetical protein
MLSCEQHLTLHTRYACGFIFCHNFCSEITNGKCAAIWRTHISYVLWDFLIPNSVMCKDRWRIMLTNICSAFLQAAPRIYTLNSVLNLYETVYLCFEMFTFSF